METPVRTCTGCNQTKPYTADFFPRDESKKTGLHARCKDCRQLQKSKGQMLARTRTVKRVRPPMDVMLASNTREAVLRRKALGVLIARHRQELEDLFALMYRGEITDTSAWVDAGKLLAS